MNFRISNSSSGPSVKLALASAVVALTLAACGEPVPPNDSVAQRPESTASRTAPSERPAMAPAQTIPPANSVPPSGTDAGKTDAPKQ